MPSELVLQFNDLIRWKETLNQAKQCAFLCDGCKKGMEDAIARIDVRLEEINQECEGVLC
jgi:hypothetical protein